MRLSVWIDALVVVASLGAITMTALYVRGPVRRDSAKSQTPQTVEAWHAYASVGHRLGGDSATVTILTFGDYQCSACRYFHRTVSGLLARRDGQVAVVHRHFPLRRHPLAQTAARAVECASEQGRFDAYHETLYTDSAWLGLGSKALEDYARATDVRDMPRFTTCLYSREPVAAIERDIRAAEALGITGTPLIMINGRLIRGVPDSAELEGLIHRALRSD
jgi:protein-disulfide isomerase